TPLGRSIQKPYNKGRDAYNDEVIARFHNGEVIHGDTSSIHTGPVFKTAAGRQVYGGGGITPDVFVALHTTQFSKTVSALYISGILNNFIYEYYMQNLAELKKFRSPADFYTGFNHGSEIWRDLTAYAGKDSIDLNGLNGEDRRQVEFRVKALLARLLWRTQGYFYVINQTDP